MLPRLEGSRSAACSCKRDCVTGRAEGELFLSHTNLPVERMWVVLLLV